MNDSAQVHPGWLFAAGLATGVAAAMIAAQALRLAASGTSAARSKLATRANCGCRAGSRPSDRRDW